MVRTFAGVIVVDSSVWIASFRGLERPSVLRLRQLLLTQRLIVGDLILLEVLQGARNDQHASRLDTQLRRYEVVSMLDDSLVGATARNFRRLRSVGITPRKTIDLIIGTYCIEHRHALLQDDRDFLPMAEHLGLRLI